MSRPPCISRLSIWGEASERGPHCGPGPSPVPGAPSRYQPHFMINRQLNSEASEVLKFPGRRPVQGEQTSDRANALKANDWTLFSEVFSPLLPLCP